MVLKKKKKKVLLMSRCLGKKWLLFYKAILVWRGGPCPKDTALGDKHREKLLHQGHAHPSSYQKFALGENLLLLGWAGSEQGQVCTHRFESLNRKAAQWKG